MTAGCFAGQGLAAVYFLRTSNVRDSALALESCPSAIGQSLPVELPGTSEFGPK
jgi:hypothetical protein